MDAGATNRDGAGLAAVDWPEASERDPLDVAPPRTPRQVVVLAEDALVREGVSKLLTGCELIETEGAASVEELERTIGASRAEVALWYADHAGGEAIARLCALRQDYGVGICIVAQSFDVHAVREAYRSSADGLSIIMRACSLQVRDVWRAIVQSAGGGVVISSSILEQLIVDSQAREAHVLCRLTDHERTVLELLAAGLRNRAIAERLDRSEKAVEKHISRIFAKLELSDDAKVIDRRVKAARIQLFAQSPTDAPSVRSS